jgi:hypothetical protein
MTRSLRLRVQREPRFYTRTFLEAAVRVDGAGYTNLSPVDNFVLGTTKPDSTNTGVPVGMVLTPVAGDIIVTTPGTIIEGKDISGFVSIRAANVTVRYCKIRGRGTSFVYYGLIDTRDAGCVNANIYQNTLASDYPQFWLNGVDGGNFTALRNDVSRVTDQFNTRIGNINVLGNYIHDFAFSDQSTDQASSTPPYWTHNDGVQLRGGGSNTIKGNSFLTYADPSIPAAATLAANGYPRYNWGSSVTCSPDNAPGEHNNIVTLNWFEGGTANYQASTLNTSHGASWGDNNFGEISYNRFGMDQYNYGNNSRYQIRYKNGWSIAGLTTNYFDPDAASVPAPLKGQTFSVGFSTGIRIDA